MCSHILEAMVPPPEKWNWKGWKEETTLEARLTFPHPDDSVFELTWKSPSLQKLDLIGLNQVVRLSRLQNDVGERDA